MSDNTQQEAGKSEARIRFDKTVNVPTLFTVLGMLAGFWWWGVNIYSDLRIKDTENAQAIAQVKGDVARVENAQILMQRDVRDDLGKINDKLDRLSERLLSPASPRAQGWTKP